MSTFKIKCKERVKLQVMLLSDQFLILRCMKVWLSENDKGKCDHFKRTSSRNLKNFATGIHTLSSARMALSFMMSWKRRKLLVPMDWSSRRRHRATSWGRVRLSRVSSSSNSLENFMICSLLGRSPESRIYKDETVMTCKSLWTREVCYKSES